MRTKLIPPSHFVEEMERHWTERLGNVSSEALRRTWLQMAVYFAKHILSHDQKDLREEWTILSPPTGSGKTQGTIVYCSMLADFEPDEHPGVLIVTRRKADANDIARQINEYSGKVCAFAYHSDSKKGIKITDLEQWPVLVITHRAYELALDFLGAEGTIESTWRYFHAFNNGGNFDFDKLFEEGNRRKLVVVDECLDIIEHNRVDLDRIRYLLGSIPQHAREKFPAAITSIKFMENIMEELSKRAEDTESEKILLKEKVSQGEAPDFTELRRYLRDHVRFDRLVGKNNKDDNEYLKNKHDETLRSLHHIYQRWIYYAKTDNQHTLNTARLLLPDGVKGCVVLDATATSNILYKVFDQANRIVPPEGSRSYGNVTVHVSRGHKTGKNFMTKNVKDVCSHLVTDLDNRLQGRRVFIATHQHVEPVLLSFETKFERKVAHYGAIDGANEFRDCDTAVIFGLPYRPSYWSANVFMACQGVQDNDWLHGPERPFKEHSDIREALQTGQIIVDVVQAINRARCRKVIDDHGNCPVTDVYLLLPADFRADEIIKGIKTEMPGVVVKEDWDFNGQKKKARRSNHEEALMALFKTMMPGKVSKSDVQGVIGASSATMDRLITKAQDPESELHKAMTEAGVTYEVKRKSKTQRGFFVKK